jgi:hypothetical protein
MLRLVTCMSMKKGKSLSRPDLQGLARARRVRARKATVSLGSRHSLSAFIPNLYKLRHQAEVSSGTAKVFQT